MIENKKSIQIPASNEGINQLEAFIEDICYHYNIINSYYSNIQLAVNEAFLNAKIHGNKNNEESFIDVYFFSDSKGLHFIISDQGTGYKYEKYLQDDLIDHIDDNKSRGLIMIKLLVDEMNISEGGKTIELIFYISTINYTLTAERKKLLENYFKNVSYIKPKEL